jgi:hypothetical protein
MTLRIGGLYTPALLSALLVAACGARSGLLGVEGDTEGTDVERRPDAATDIPEHRTIPPKCSRADETILLITTEGNLHGFDPLTLRTELIGKLTCGTQINSMTVARSGALYVGASNGALFIANSRSLTCTPTPFDGSQVGFERYGMGFTADDMPSGESLFIAPRTGDRVSQLMRLDTESFVASVIGTFSPSLPQSEVKGTGDGRLYLVHVADDTLGARLIAVDKETAALGRSVDLPLPANYRGFDFAFWGGDFYIFSAASADTTAKVVRYRPSDGSVRELGRIPPIVVGAGASTCAPL